MGRLFRRHWLRRLQAAISYIDDMSRRCDLPMLPITHYLIPNYLITNSAFCFTHSPFTVYDLPLTI